MKWQKGAVLSGLVQQTREVTIMDFKYIAVDLGRQRILIVANSMAELNRFILSQRGQTIIQKQAVWIYRIDSQTLNQVQQKMTQSGASFGQLVRPVE